MRNILVGAGLVGIASIIVMACSSSDLDTVPASSGTSKKERPAASADAAIATPPSTPTSPAPPPAPPPAECSRNQGADACYECCKAKFPGGGQVYDQALMTCACAPTTCATQCAQSVCAATPVDPVEGDACSTCIDDTTDCGDQADKACDENAACAGLLDCLAASHCDDPGDGGM